MLDTFFPIMLLVIVSAAIALLLAFMSIFIGYRSKLGKKGEPYECGLEAQGNIKEPVPVKFYMVAILFILFDIEVIFLYPYAVMARELGMFGLIEICVFVAILLVGYFYVLGRGALKWD